VIGAHADVGVLSGGGSSQVLPVGGAGLEIPVTMGLSSAFSQVTYHPSAPLAAIRGLTRNTEVVYASGEDHAAAAALAKDADVAIVFADQWATEAEDLPTLSLPNNQDALIAAVAAANARTVVVLETGTPVLAPWLSDVSALLQTWYPGTRGGEAIARILFGEVEPSGRLPVTIAADAGQLPRAKPAGSDIEQKEGAAPGGGAPFSVDYPEGSSVGYRWFAEKGFKPLFPFGYGLSYTSFRYGALTLTGGKDLAASIPVTNAGTREGVETVQLYLSKGPERGQRRLIGWAQVKLKPGETRTVSIKAEPKVLANWDDKAHGWRLAGGRYEVFAGPNAETWAASGAAELQSANLAP
jgi:beta-glucosidase